jgi:hypothetical protein
VAAAFTVVVALAFVVWPATPDRVVPPDNEAAPALVVADDAPDAVLEQVLATARASGDESLRDPSDPSEPLDLASVDAGDLPGTPVAVSTTELVDHSFTTMVWNFRLQALAGLALMVAVTAAVLGLLLDMGARAGSPEREPAGVGG